MKCQICSLTVAPQDPERQTVAGKPVHGNCLKRHIAQSKIKQEQALQVAPAGPFHTSGEYAH